jgi:hypothetical protein
MDQTPSANPCYDPRGSKGFFDVWEDDETAVPALGDVFDDDNNNTNTIFSSNNVRTNPPNYNSNHVHSNHVHSSALSSNPPYTGSNPGNELSPRRDESRGRERRVGVAGPNQSVQIANQLSLSGMIPFIHFVL